MLSKGHLLDFLRNYVLDDYRLSLYVTTSRYLLLHVNIIGLDSETYLKLQLSLNTRAALLKHLYTLRSLKISN